MLIEPLYIINESQKFNIPKFISALLDKNPSINNKSKPIQISHYIIEINILKTIRLPNVVIFHDLRVKPGVSINFYVDSHNIDKLFTLTNKHPFTHKMT